MVDGRRRNNHSTSFIASDVRERPARLQKRVDRGHSAKMSFYSGICMLNFSNAGCPIDTVIMIFRTLRNTICTFILSARAASLRCAHRCLYWRELQTTSLPKTSTLSSSRAPPLPPSLAPSSFFSPVSFQIAAPFFTQYPCSAQSTESLSIRKHSITPPAPLVIVV
jgi:hypothetical protein